MRKNLIQSINEALRIMVLNENNPTAQSAPDNNIDDEAPPQPKPLPADYVEYTDHESPTNRWLRDRFPLSWTWRRIPPSIPGYSNPTLNDDLEWVIYDSNGNVLYIWNPNQENGYGRRGMWVPVET